MFDTQELLMHILDIQETEDGDDEQYEQEIEDKLYSGYWMDVDQFDALVHKLINMIDVWTSPITNKRHKGFSKDLGEWTKQWLLKVDIK